MMLVSSITGKPPGKPWATFLMDAYSRRLLAVYVTFDPPSYRSCMARLSAFAELRHVYEPALERRGVRTILLDEAQHLLKLASGIKLVDQLDWLKSMAMEATSGEQELRYTASRRQHLWILLGMNVEAEEQKAPPTPPSQREGSPQDLRVGEPKPRRYEVGEHKEEERAEKCSFSNAAIALSPAQLAQAGVTKCQCPECGAIWTARIRGETVSFPPHQPLQRPRPRAIPRWD